MCLQCMQECCAEMWCKFHANFKISKYHRSCFALKAPIPPTPTPLHTHPHHPFPCSVRLSPYILFWAACMLMSAWTDGDSRLAGASAES